MPGPRARWSRCALLATALTVSLHACGGDDDPTPPPAATLGVALSAPTIAVEQGQTRTVTVAVVQSGGTPGAVSVTVAGAPAGVTTTVAPVAGVTGTTGSELTLAVAPTTAPGAYPLTVTATNGSRTAQATLGLTVTAGPQTLTVTVGGSGAGVVTSSPGGVSCPGSCTATFPGGTSVTLSAAPRGSDVFTGWTGACSGTAACTVALTAAQSVGATFAPPPANLTLGFGVCDPSDAPIWLAFQHGAGAWTRATADASRAYRGDVGPRGGVAYVTTKSNGAYALTVRYGTVDELAAVGAGECTLNPAGTKRLTARAAGVQPTDFLDVHVGGAYNGGSGRDSLRIDLDGVPAGPRDLLATRTSRTSDASMLERMILRRGVDYPDGSVIPTLDFGSAEAFAPVVRTLTLENLGGDRLVQTELAHVSPDGTPSGFFFQFASGSAQAYVAIPAERLGAGDLQQAQILAVSSFSANALRGALLHFREPTNRTLTLGPSASAASITSLGAAPYLRYRAQAATQAAYGSMALADYSQGSGNGASVLATAAYLGGLPVVWTLDVPDLSGAGFDPAWALRPGVATSWAVGVIGGDGLPLFGAMPKNDTGALIASQFGTLASGLRATPAPGARRSLLRARPIAPAARTSTMPDPTMR